VPPLLLFSLLLNHRYERVPPSVTLAVTVRAAAGLLGL
jgi:hypothetical protein